MQRIVPAKREAAGRVRQGGSCEEATGAQAALQAMALSLRSDGRLEGKGGSARVTAVAKGMAAVVTAVPAREMGIVAAAKAELKRAAEAGYVVRAQAVETDSLKAVREQMVARALHDARADEDGLGIKGADDALLKGLLDAAYRALENRYALSTRKLDRSYWRLWSEFCARLHTPALRVNQAANDGSIPRLHRREVALALGCFMTWAAEAAGRWKLESMVSRLRGVARRHAAVGIKFVSLALVVQAAAGLVREHIDTHGEDALRRHSKEPFETAELEALLMLPIGTAVAPGVVVGDNVELQGVRVFIALFCTGGFRKEAIAIGDGESFGYRKLALFQVTWRLRHVLLRAPTVHQLLAISEATADMSYVSTVPCKNDQDNSKFGNQPVPSRYSATRVINLARELARYEVMRMQADGVERYEQAERRQKPLVLAPGGRSWTKKQLDAFFKALIRLVCSEQRARQLSVHSFRVWLACALLAAGATPEQIMLLLRWSSEAAYRLYARIGDARAAGLIDAGFDASFATVRSHTLLELATERPLSATEQAAMVAGRQLAESAAMLERVTAGQAAVARADELHARVVTDDDHVYAALEQHGEALLAAAARADAAAEAAVKERREESSDEEDD